MIVASRYAKSLLDLSVEKGQLEAVYKDMQLLGQVCRQNHDFISFLNSPIVKIDKKQEVIHALFKDKVSALTIAFLDIIVRKRRESYIPQIATSFSELYKNHKNILTAVITSAIGLDDTTRTKALELVKKQANGEVELIEKIDKDLLGGFVLRIGDKQVDKSVLRQLNNLRKDFSENPYVSEL